MFDFNHATPDFAVRPRLYCVWTRANQEPNAPLVAIWIDREMTAFQSSGQEHPVDSSSAPLLAAEPDEYSLR